MMPVLKYIKYCTGVRKNTENVVYRRHYMIGKAGRITAVLMAALMALSPVTVYAGELESITEEAGLTVDGFCDDGEAKEEIPTEDPADDKLADASPDDAWEVKDGVLIKYKGGWPKDSILEVPADLGIKTIGPEAFGEYPGLKKIVLPDTVTTIDHDAFLNVQIESINIPGSVTSIGDYAFKSTHLNSISIPNGVKWIGEYAFQDCQYLKRAEIPGSVKTIRRWTFGDCVALSELVIAEGVETIEENAFHNCRSLNDPHLADSITSIGNNAFEANYSDESNMISIKLPANLKELGDYAFAKNAFKHVDLPEKLETIGEGAFFNCRLLGSIYIPKSVKTIKNWAFENCNALTEVYYEGSSALWEERFGSALIGWWGTPHFNYSKRIPVKSVSISGAPSVIYPGDKFSLKVSVKPSNATNKQVVWKSSTPGVAQIALDGTVTAAKAGKTTITATSIDNDSASASIDITVSKSSGKVQRITIIDRYTYVHPGDKYQLEVEIYPADAKNKSVKWASSKPGTVSVDKNGWVTCKKVGKAVITATAKDGSNVVGKLDVNVTPTKPVTKITISKAPKKIYPGKTFTLTATLKPKNPTINSVKWTSSDKSVATVDQLGVVTAKKKGETTIKCTAKDGSGVFGSRKIKVKKGKPITRITLNKTKATIKMHKKKTLKLKATIKPKGATCKKLKWMSSDPSVATVDENGKVKAVKPGKTTITAKAKDGSKVKAKCKITVKE